MNDTVQNLADLDQLSAEGAAPEAQPAAPTYEPVRDEFGRSYATGRRKESAARVWVKPGSGVVMINGRPIDQYFARPVLQMLLHQPFQVTDRLGQFDVMATVKGGGLSGQAGAVRHGISRALSLCEPELKI